MAHRQLIFIENRWHVETLDSDGARVGLSPASAEVIQHFETLEILKCQSRALEVIAGVMQNWPMVIPETPRTTTYRG